MTNPLLIPSPLPYELPDFGRLEFHHYREAIEAGMAQHSDQVRAIVENTEEPTFENTMVELEKSGGIFGAALRVFFSLVSSDSTKELLDLEQEMSTVISAHVDSITLNPGLFARIKKLHDTIDDLGLTAEQHQLLAVQYRRMMLRGAGLDDAGRAELGAMNSRIAELESEFSRKLLDDTNDSAVVFDNADDLAGASPEQISSCQAAAEARGLAGKFVVPLVLPTAQPLLADLSKRESRRRLLDAAMARGNRGNEHDTNKTVIELVKMRARRAKLLGFANHAEVATVDQTAGSPAAIEATIYPMAAPAAANAVKEAAALQAYVDAEQDRLGEPRFTIEAHDWFYYTEKVRAEKFSVDTTALKPYFEATRVIEDGVFYAAEQLYGLTFKKRTDLKSFHEDIQVYEVFDEAGKPTALFLMDLYARASKRGGAWMNNLVEQSHLLGQRPVICNTLNVPKPASGPTLLTIDEVGTLFHEFGHALHGLLSDCEFESLSGTSVPRDFVEFPSQVNEMWQDWTEVIGNYAKHYETGEALDPAIIKKLQDQATFNQGYETSAYLASALVDQEWHKITEDADIESVEAFEADALRKLGLDNPLVPPRYKSTYFNHTFGGGYDAGYYAYIWSEVMDADAVAWFKENGGMTRANGEHLRKEVLSRGLTRDPMDSYRAFRGQDPDVKYLLARRGITS